MPVRFQHGLPDAVCEADPGAAGQHSDVVERAVVVHESERLRGLLGVCEGCLHSGDAGRGHGAARPDSVTSAQV